MNPFTKVPLIVVSALVALVAVYTAGQYYGGRAERIKQLEAAVKAVKQRDSIDRDLSGKSDMALCQLLGGSREDCEGVEELGGSDG